MIFFLSIECVMCLYNWIFIKITKLFFLQAWTDLPRLLNVKSSLMNLIQIKKSICSLCRPELALWALIWSVRIVWWYWMLAGIHVTTPKPFAESIDMARRNSAMFIASLWTIVSNEKSMIVKSINRACPIELSMNAIRMRICQ